MMASFHPNILQLPDLVLYKICSVIQCPFDLLRFGNTCSHLRKISLSRSLWWNLAFNWCKGGLWIFMKNYPTDDNPRDWLIAVLKRCSLSNEELKCNFSNGEMWKRVDSQKFRCIVGMLRWAYSKEKEDHPAILFEQWLYDVGLFRRISPCVDFSSPTDELPENTILQLCRAGQALERDLRRRRQPYKDLSYYVSRIANSDSNWKEELFPTGPHGTVCPLLMCPFQNAVTHEVSGLKGLAVCFSIVLERRLYAQYKSVLFPLHKFCDIIKCFTNIFIGKVKNFLPLLEDRLGPMSLKSAMLIFAKENCFNTESLQIMLERCALKFSCGDILQDTADLLNKYEGIDLIVDAVRNRLRHELFDEITNVLFPQGSNSTLVTRINLTDSDLIGGDNSKQEMSAAAFISEHGVLITWHLIGRMRF